MQVGLWLFWVNSKTSLDGIFIHQRQQVLYFAFKPFEAKRRRVEEEPGGDRLVPPQEGLDGAAGRWEQSEQLLPAASGATPALQNSPRVLMHQLQGETKSPSLQPAHVSALLLHNPQNAVV